MMALTMSIVALAIDAMLPAHGDIGREFAVADVNDTQYVVYTIFVGLGLGQFLFGPLSDAWGRKPALYLGLGIFTIGTLISLTAPSFSVLLAGRFLQGIGVAAPRTMTVTIVRDLFTGRNMARVMSFVISIFILVPAIAPALGQVLINAFGWRSIFWSFLGLTGVIAAWFALRQPETLSPSHCQSLSPRRIGSNMLVVLRTRVAVGYTIAAAAISGAFVGFLGTAQQVFAEQYALGDKFPLVFALLAISIGVSTLINGNVVVRIGMRALAKGSSVMAVIASLAFFAATLFWQGQPPLPVTVACMMSLFLFVGFLFGNLNALAMEPLGHIAGTAAAIIGSVSTLISAMLGAFSGALYNGTLAPMAGSFLMMTALTVVAIFATDRYSNA